MVQEKPKTIAQEMCIEKAREVELMKMVVDKIFNGEFATADYLKELITTLDLTTKEIVYMSYMFGVLSTKQNKEMSNSIQSNQPSQQSTPETKQLQNQIARQQEQINQLQTKDKKRWGFGKTVVAYTAADIALSGLFNLF